MGLAARFGQLAPRRRAARGPDPAAVWTAITEGALFGASHAIGSSAPTVFLPGGRAVANGTGIDAGTRAPLELSAGVRIDRELR